MPRHPRLFLLGAIYHVYCRVGRGEFVFDDEFEAIEFTTLAVGRYGLRVCDVAALLRKHPNSVTHWLNRGLRLERDDPESKKRLDQLAAAISRRG